MPKCYVCLENKSEKFFTKDRSRTSGYSSKCKSCASKRVSQYREDGRYAQKLGETRRKYKTRLLEKGLVSCGACNLVKEKHPNYATRCIDCGEELFNKAERKKKENLTKLREQTRLKQLKLQPPEGFGYCYMCKNFVPTCHMHTEKLCVTHSKYKKWRNTIHGAKKRAKEKGLEFNLFDDIEKLKPPKYCPVLGIKLNILSDNINESPSLDRLDNTKGYTVDNVRIISTRANLLKKDATLEEMKAIVKYMENFTENY